MPPVITFFTAIGTAVAATYGIALVGTAATILGGIITVGTIYAAVSASNAARAASGGAASIMGTLVNKEGTSMPIPVVYGKRRVGGHRSFLASNGTDNNKLHMVMTFCEGTIDGFEQVHFNDELAASFNGSTWTYHNGYGAVLYIEAFNGNQTSACTSLVNENVGWTSAHVGRGVAYLYLKFTYDEEVYDSGLPDITATLRGKKIYDPLIQQTTFTTNPAIIIYDYMTDDFYGKGINPNLIRLDKLQEAKSYYGTVIAFPGGTEPRYQINAVVNTDAKMLDNLNLMLLSCRSSLVTAENYQLLPDQPVDTSNAVSVNDDNIIGNITYLQASKRSLLNEVRAKYPNANDPDYNYKEDFVIVKSDALQVTDGVRLKIDLDLPYTVTTTMVERILTEEINQSRQSGKLSVKTTTQLLATTVGDVVKFTNETLGQTEKLYKISGQTLTSDHEMEMVLTEYDPDVYWSNNQSIILNNKDDFEL